MSAKKQILEMNFLIKNIVTSFNETEKEIYKERVIDKTLEVTGKDYNIHQCIRYWSSKRVNAEILLYR